MRIKSKGLEVVLLQARLRNLNYFSLNINGLFEETTKEAVKEFQTKEKLSIDGIAGKNTNKRLKALTKNAWLFTFIHCSATQEGQNVTPQAVARYHKIKKGWSRAGYSDIIDIYGKLANITPYNSDGLISDWEYSFGVKKRTLLNRNARHVCYIGGVNNKEAKDTRTPKQKRSLYTYLNYQILLNPKVLILGHNQVQKKACPSFDVFNEYGYLGIGKSNFMQERYPI
jgi:peptidoglycan hydrolase-like protein with peptidoglycan-binding domain